MTHRDSLEQLKEKQVIGEIDLHFASAIADLDPDCALAPYAAALVSSITRDGDSCLDPRNAGLRQRYAESKVDLPEPDAWISQLRTSPLIGSPDTETRTPLMLDNSGRLYLYRFWKSQKVIADRIRELLNSPVRSRANTRDMFEQIAPDQHEKALQAAEAAAMNRFCVISGGPGTGKTTLVASIVMLLVELELVDHRRIVFVAPTGKAASRLQESLALRFRNLRHAGTNQPIAQVRTVHRWLIEDRSSVKPPQLLVIDECSMVDLSLMARVMQAIGPDTRIILLGDASQLASVLPGSVFGDLCQSASDPDSPLRDCVVELTKNWRFPETSQIGKLATSIRNGDEDAVLSLLHAADGDMIEWNRMPDDTAIRNLAQQTARKHFIPLVRELKDRKSVDSSAFGPLRVLCGHRRGRFGSDYFNSVVERELQDEHIAHQTGELYPGRLLIVSRNDRRSGLSNGDTGIVLRGGGGLRIWFPELHDDDGSTRVVAESRLPSHESYYALTIHRSQGSEYDEIVVIPGPADSSVLSREVLYTAMTRARKRIVVHAGEEALRLCIRRRTSRSSGLKDMLAGRS